MKYFCSMAYLGKEGRGRKKERENPLAVDFAFQYPPTSLPLMRGNKLRGLGVAGARRLKSIPDIPCFKDLGINAEYYGWVGIAAPKKTPTPIVEKLREATKNW